MKALKDIVAMLRSKFSDMDWTLDKSEMDMQRAVKASLEMGNILRKYEVWLSGYKQAMKRKGWA
jgi:hypothetical protein